MGHIVIVSGSPGVGKSTIARLLADNSPNEAAVHIHTDDFYTYIRKGYIEPWRPEANKQNITVSKAIVSSTKNFAENGYEVLVDGVVGSWLLDPWIEMANSGMDVHYVILRPSLEITAARNLKREKKIALDVITRMWNEFTEMGLYEANVVNTTSQSPEETAVAIRNMLNEGCLRIKACI